MNCYRFVRPLLFSLPPEVSHHLALSTLDISHTLGLLSFFSKLPSAPRRVMNIDFPNPVGLAAGLDKNAAHLNGLGALGFGFLEVGTVTPKPQLGNPKPRLFRLVKEQALINRMGFNNVGLDQLVKNLSATSYRGVLGVNIGKNATTPAEEAAQDYLTCFREVYPFASYIVVNVSSPNTVGLRALQAAEWLIPLLQLLKKEQGMQREATKRDVPLVVKVAPDLKVEEIDEIADVLRQVGVDGLIATNTSIGRAGIENHLHAEEAGGLSGKPLSEKARAVVAAFAERLKGEIPIIGSGGVMSADDALRMLDSGASLVQVYTGLIYNGLTLVREIVERLQNKALEQKNN